jgi:signal transduction histidine kinase
MRRVGQSIAGNLARHLGTFGALIFSVALIGSLLIDALGNPAELRNALTLNILEKSVRSAAADAFSLTETPALGTIKAQSPNLWFVVSDGRTLVEHNAPARPVLPVDIRIDGPSLSAAFSTGDRSTSIRTVTIPSFEGRIVMATSGASPNLVDVVVYYLQANAVRIMFGAVVLALLIAATVGIAIRQIARSIRGMAQAAAEIAPDNPKGELNSNRVPIELQPLTRALDSALDRIAESMGQQRRFISNAAHELRTPLAILRVKIEVIEDLKLRSNLVADLQRLTSLVAAMLDLARMNANASGLAMTTVDLAAVAQGVLRDLGPIIIDRGLDASFEAPSFPVQIIGNEAVLQSAVANLITNAVSHSQTATRLDVRVLAEGILEVADDGVGIPAASRDDVIEPFARLSATADGTGLGLAIVRDIMLAHGGTLMIGDTQGGGLTVRLVFTNRSPEGY